MSVLSGVLTKDEEFQSLDFNSEYSDFTKNKQDFTRQKWTQHPQLHMSGLEPEE